MAASVIRIPTGSREAAAMVEVLLPARPTRLAPPLPFPAPLLHPQAVEALLLAFRSLDGDGGLERPGSTKG